MERPGFIRQTDSRDKGTGSMNATSRGSGNRVWKCEQVRAGRVMHQVVFDTKEQASHFVTQMQRVEPDLFWRMEPVEPYRVWN